MKRLELDHITITFEDIPNGLNQGVELSVYNGDEINSRHLGKDEIIDLIKYLVETL